MKGNFLNTRLWLMAILALVVVFSSLGCQATSKEPSTEAAPVETEVQTEAPDEATANSEAPAEEAPADAVQEGFLPGKKAYDFELKNLAGEVVKLSDYTGKTVVLNFFASWCPPCQVEMPHINRVYEALKDQDVVILGINLTQQDDMNDLNQLLEDNNITFPILLDENSDVATLYAIRSIPVNVVINPEGIVTEYAVGAVDETRLTEYIEAAK